MPISISNQAYVFLCAIIGGALIAFLYDVLRIKRKAVRTHNFMVYIEDLIYWIIVALVAFGVVYYSNDGEIRGYILIGTVIGVILYTLLLSKLVMASFLFLLQILYKIIKTLWSIISYPFKMIFKILSVPMRFIWRLLSKLFRKAKRTGKNNLSRMRIWRRIFRNIRKKI